ncbi:MAG: hypothetical protein COA90_06610 [Gammaproteobacteria bacterium]|nr:MAG: hypothetical protein COA90_06610 [Gammaproteobacteria bacterium]
MIKLIAKLLPVLILSACSHDEAHPQGPLLPPLQEEFTTQILDMGEKNFTFRVMTPVEHKPFDAEASPPRGERLPSAGSKGGPPSGGMGGGPPGGGSGGPPSGNVPQGGGQHQARDNDRPEPADINLEKRLQDMLAKIQYCQQAYIIHNTFIGETSQVIIGECVELATEKDKLNFPNEFIPVNK